MFRWLFQKKNELPSYSLLEAIPDRGLPQDLADDEHSPAFDQRRGQMESELRERPEHEQRWESWFLQSGPGLLTFQRPKPQGRCLLAFSSPIRAADYARMAAPGQKFSYLCSTPEEVVRVIHDFQQFAGASDIAFDRCPRCGILLAFSLGKIAGASDVIGLWRMLKAGERARYALYCDYARAAASAGDLLRARDVALQAVGHVAIDHPGGHLLLAQLAAALQDRRLLREAKDFLTLLGQDNALEELRRAEKRERSSF